MMGTTGIEQRAVRMQADKESLDRASGLLATQLGALLKDAGGHIETAHWRGPMKCTVQLDAKADHLIVRLSKVYGDEETVFLARDDAIALIRMWIELYGPEFWVAKEGESCSQR